MMMLMVAARRPNLKRTQKKKQSFCFITFFHHCCKYYNAGVPKKLNRSHKFRALKTFPMVNVSNRTVAGKFFTMISFLVSFYIAWVRKLLAYDKSVVYWGFFQKICWFDINLSRWWNFCSILIAIMRSRDLCNGEMYLLIWTQLKF